MTAGSGASAEGAARGTVLEVEGVSRRFGGLEALSDVSFSVRPGAITSVIGPNGAGKSTLFNIIGGQLPATAGRIRFNGRDITRSAPHQLCRWGIARTFQTPRLFGNLTVFENVVAACGVRRRSTALEEALALPRGRRNSARHRDKARETLAAVGLSRREEALPGALPYGDRRRLEIARALVTEPLLLLLDEPAAGMIVSETRDLMRLIDDVVKGGTTVVLIEHNMTAVMGSSDHVVVLNFGRKIAEGTPAEVQRDASVLEAYLGVD